MELGILAITAASIGLFHTLLGPDHYIPFVAMAKARNWSKKKTIKITLLCGAGHVASSIILGVIGITIGAAVLSLEAIEAFRGTIAGWALLSFGLAYLLWGIRRAIKNTPHTHLHTHEDGIPHTHEHVHTHDRAHVHENTAKKRMTPWALFIIFILGPCEPLIPILMYPAAEMSIGSMILIASIFAIVTISTMLVTVGVLTAGVKRLRVQSLERFSHIFAGGAIVLCGAAIQLGL